MRLYGGPVAEEEVGNYTQGQGIGVTEYVYLRNGAQSWPQASTWEPGDRLEICWDDASKDLSLNVEDPMYRYGSPAYPDDLAGLLEFSADSEDSGEGVEWIKLLDVADDGLFTFWVDCWGGEFDPDPLAVTVNLYDSEDQPKALPCTVEVYQDYPEVYPLYWLEYNP
jgi:hypothetical protein